LSADHTLYVLAAARSTSTQPDVLHLLGVLWWLWLLVGLVLAAKAARFLWEDRRLRRSGIREIDVMDGRTFERRLGVLFRGLGYRVEATGSAGGDFGCDLLVTRGDERSVVQAKRYGKAVGIKAVQEAAAAQAYYDANGAYVVTNRAFTAQARKLAAANGVKLWGRDELVRELLRVDGGGRQASDPKPKPAASAHAVASRSASASVTTAWRGRSASPASSTATSTSVRYE
jgi:restriction system protein